jgi:aminopeptidase N
MITFTLGLAACSTTEPKATEGSATTAEASATADATRDVHSFAEPDRVKVTHLDLDLTVDFDQRTLSGMASLNLDNQGTDRLILDTRDLEIRRVLIGEDHQETTFEVGESVPFLGEPLTITIEPTTEIVHIEYATRSADAVQWLEPEQTAGGKRPFLFTQSQAILARTWVPCQDSPAVRMTYAATIRVPLGLMALMSAENPTEVDPDGIYSFQMPQPIPSYLLALSVGDLEYRAFDARSGVYAEPSMVEAAAWEFADTPQMITATEQLYGPYRWGKYDLLVLPPSFPFGGMENPRLTFVTPTIIAGDRSLVALIAHELAHSWSGNLVTNATWNDFWLNEGFTVYLERRVMERVYGDDYATLLAELGRQDLDETIARIGAGSADTDLYLDLDGRDPDDGMSDVAYEKGYFFLRRLEEAVGRETWDSFLKGYFEAHAFQSTDTAKFVTYLEDNLLSKLPKGSEGTQVDVRAWIYQPGLPSDFPTLHSSALEEVETQLAAWMGGAPAADLPTGTWNTQEWLHFLRHLPTDLSPHQMAELDAASGFTQSGNSEILAEWLTQAIHANYEPAYPAVEKFLTSIGRRKFLMPLYRGLVATDAGRARALEIYAKARPTYHPVAVSSVDALLEWPAEEGVDGD